jgi:hypothetical protein
MKILLIISNQHNITYYTNTLLEITDKESIIVCNSFTEANNFIANEILKKQLELDLIITQNKFEFDYNTGAEFHQKIKFNYKSTYSNFDFNWHSIPVILLLGKNENRDAYLRTTDYEYNDLIGFPEKLELYIPEITNKVKGWRRQLLDELSNLGIDYKSGLLDYSKYDFFKLSRPTFILSDNFKRIPRPLKYTWLNINYSQIEQSVDEFIKEMKWSEREKRRDEKRFHRFFKKFPLFLQRDVYQKYWYEPKLKYEDEYQDNDYIEPDFALKPSFTKNTDLSILEIKLPQDRFITKTKFHPRPYSSFISHLFQVNDYKEYLENEDHKTEINRVMGFNPKRFDYNLLIGRKEHKEEVTDTLNKRMNQMNMNYINLITYDELMEYQVRFMERLKLLEIK